MLPSAYYYNAVQEINLSRSKDATAEVAISLSWTDNAGVEQSRDASVKLQIAKNGVYSGWVRTLMGRTITLTSHDINFHFDHNIQAHPPYLQNEPFLTVHLFRLSDLLALSLDELCETILMESIGGEVKPVEPSSVAVMLQARNLLWEKLKGNKLGIRFRKGYFASGGFRSGSFYDFVSDKGRLTIDVSKESKKFSVEQYLFSHGRQTTQYVHLYFTPEEVLKNPDDVIGRIRQEVR